LVKKPEGKRLFGRPVSRMEDNIEINPTKIGWEKVERIHLAQGMCMVGSCEHGNAHSGSTKCGEFLEYLRKY
jgi:hypothetical protein